MSDPEDDVAFAAAEDAFMRTTALPRNKPRKEDFVCPLGSDNLDWWVYDHLCNAGIAVELLELDETEGGSRYVFAQIVDEVDLNSVMQKATSPENIFLCNAEEMLGVQVKLNAAHKWKLTIVNENMPQHPIASASTRIPVQALCTTEILGGYLWGSYSELSRGPAIFHPKSARFTLVTADCTTRSECTHNSSATL